MRSNVFKYKNIFKRGYNPELSSHQKIKKAIDDSVFYTNYELFFKTILTKESWSKVRSYIRLSDRDKNLEISLPRIPIIPLFLQRNDFDEGYETVSAKQILETLYAVGISDSFMKSFFELFGADSLEEVDAFKKIDIISIKY